MTPQELNSAYIGAGFQQVRGERVTQRVRSNGLGNPGGTMGFLAGQFDGTPGDGLTAQVARK